MNRMRSTKSRRNNRRSQQQVTGVAYTTDGDGTVRQRHRASRITGKYRGREVIDVSRETQKTEKKAMKQQEQKNNNNEKKTVEQVTAPPA